ncbi:MAG: glycosyltransferase [Acidobacteriota bacterium]
MPDFEEVNPQRIGAAEIVVGIPSYNEAETLAHVVRVVDQGLQLHFREQAVAIINADNASTDGTRDVFLSTETGTPRIYLTTPQGVRGKGSNLLNLFARARDLGAQAVAVVDSDLRSIEPRWVQKLVNPVLKGYDLVTPIYIRHKYDGTITNNVAYPLVSALFGRRIRQPIGGEFGFSKQLIDRLLSLPASGPVRHFGIDIWLTTQACIQGMKICQSFMDAPKVHNPKDPGDGLDAMFRDVAGVLFTCMIDHPDAWLTVETTKPSVMYGFGMGARRRPQAVTVNTGNLYRQFTRAFATYREDIEQVLAPRQWNELRATLQKDPFDQKLSRELWTRIVYDVAVAYSIDLLPRKRLLDLTLGLYKGKVLSDLLELTEMGPWYAERHVERLVDRFEREKPYLVERWHQAHAG